MIRIPAEALRAGEAVPFQFPPNLTSPPSFRSSFIDHEVILTVKSTSRGPPIRRSRYARRLRPARRSTATRTRASSGASGYGGSPRDGREHRGLREGRAPTSSKATSAVPFDVRIGDAPRDGRLGIHVDLESSRRRAGIDFRPLGLLEGLPTHRCCRPPSPSATCCAARPETARSPCRRRRRPDRIRAASARYIARRESLRLSDHHLGSTCRSQRRAASHGRHRPRGACEGDGHHRRHRGGFRFPTRSPRRDQRGTQRRPSRTHSSFHRPLAARADVPRAGARGEERTITASLRTSGRRRGRPLTSTSAFVRPRSPRLAWAELESETPTERMRAVRALFPSAHVIGAR